MPRKKKSPPFVEKKIYPTVMYKNGEAKTLKTAFELQEAKKDGWKDKP
jgi:hypothetical protein